MFANYNYKLKHVFFIKNQYLIYSYETMDHIIFYNNFLIIETMDHIIL